MVDIDEDRYRMLLEDAETIGLASRLLNQVIESFIKRLEELMRKEEIFGGRNS